MKPKHKLLDKKKFFLHTVLPVLLAMGMFMVLIFAVLIPYVEYHLLNGKKEIIREQITTIHSLIAHYEQETGIEKTSREEAQKMAIRQISALRYGVSQKDYFWITDTTPKMIAHPYRSDLNGQDLTDFADPDGKKLFMESVKATAATGEAFIHYQWQWMDDSLRIVPKISFVKRFEAWGWIIGTGIYIEDVREEIEGIKEKLVYTMLGIGGLIGVLMLYNIRQQLRTELQRLEAENQLRTSRERYKTLVEASADGLMIVSGNRLIYTNPVIRNKIDVYDNMPISDDLREILATHRRQDMQRIEQWIKSGSMNLSIETELTGRSGTLLDAVVSFSKGVISGQKTILVTIKDISIKKRESNNQLSEDWINLTESFGLGYFRSQIGRKSRIIAANPTARRLLGYASDEELYRTAILSMIPDIQERKHFMRTLDQYDAVSNYPIQIKTRDQQLRDLSVTAVIRRNPDGQALYVEGIIRDISQELECLRAKDAILSQLAIPWQYWNQEVYRFSEKAEFCSYLLALTEAASCFKTTLAEVLFITATTGEALGVLTKKIFLNAFAQRFIHPQQAVFEVMESPIVAIDKNAPLLDAVMEMENHQSEYIALKEANGAISGVITKNNITTLFHKAYAMIGKAKRKWEYLDDMKKERRQIEQVIAAMVDGGAPISRITQWYSEFAGAIAQQMSEWVFREMGSPPCPFAFLALGSEGRYEQTLLTDQDNALIYLSSEDHQAENIRDYFLRFGARLNRMLDEAGFHLCKGNIMAGNPKWCQPLSVWLDYFQRWIQNPEPQAILETSIFFDFRCTIGDPNIEKSLRAAIYGQFDRHPAFFNHLAMACMNYKIPVGKFSKIQADDPNTGQLNIKSPIRVLTHIIRLYALHHRISETPTLARLERLKEKGILPSALCREMRSAYEYLVSLQLRKQVYALRRREPMSHYLALSDLSDLETDMLVSIFQRIAMFQSAIRRDFHLSG